MSWLDFAYERTKLLTMTLESPFPAAGPLGTVLLFDGFAPRVFFFTPPTGTAAVVAFVLAGFGARRARPTRRVDDRRVLRMSSRD